MTAGSRDGSPNRTPYSSFAEAYASGAERHFSEQMARFVLSELALQPGTRASVVDVACGIGAACEYFAGCGLTTIGVDASADMLRQARVNATERGLHIAYIQQDMRDLRLGVTVDLVTCMYDSLNFMLTIDDLGRAFEAARGLLNTGGTYVFDVYTLHGLADTWGTADQIHTVLDSHFVATRTTCDLDSTTSTKVLWGFNRIGEVWQGWKERHTIRAYPLEDIERCLASAGFQVRSVLAWGDSSPGPLTDDTTRAVLIATAT